MSIYFYVAWIVLLVASAQLAKAKGRRRPFWVFMTLLFGPLAFVILACLPSTKTTGDTNSARTWVSSSIGGIACFFVIAMIVGHTTEGANVKPNAYADTTPTPSVEAAPARQAETPPEPPIEITASALFRDYDANEVAADSKYKGRRLAVSGTVTSISKDFMDDPFISLATGDNEFQTVQAGFSKSQISQLATLQKGNAVTVTCIGKGMTVGTPMLDCR